MTRYSKFSSFEDQVEFKLIEFRVTVNLHFPGTVTIIRIPVEGLSVSSFALISAQVIHELAQKRF